MARPPHLLPLLLLAATLGGCASSRAIGGPPDAGGRRDGGRDGEGDAGTSPAGACAAVVADAPLGLLAFSWEGGVLAGLGAAGTRRVLHRAFADVEVEGELDRTGPLWSTELIAGLASATERCGAARCPRRSELFILTPEGVTTVDVSPPRDFRDPLLAGVTADGLVAIVLSRADGFDDAVRRFYDPDGAVVGELPIGTSLAGQAPVGPGFPGPDGWRPARLAEPDEVGWRLGFLRFQGGALETRELGREAAVAWRDAWVSWDAEGVHIDRVEGRRTVPLSVDLEGRPRTPRIHSPSGGLLELWAEGWLHGIVDLEAERPHLFPEVAGAENARVGTRSAHGRYLAAVGGAPRWSVDLASGAIDAEALPAGFAPLDASYCTPTPSLLPDGGVALVLRSSGRTGGFAIARGESPRPVGLRLRDVSFGAVIPAGPLLAVTGRTGRETFCPHVAPSDEPAAEGERVGDSLQLLDPGGAQLLDPEEGELAYLDPAGRCALLVDGEAGAPSRYLLRDFATGEEATWEAPSGSPGWLPLETAPLYAF
jgi:hypothetical protein